MSMQNELDLNTLIWVKSEIDETLNQARKSLEVYIEDEDDSSQIQFCLNYLHQVRGTLQMVELYGSAMVAEEMENLVQAIINNKVSNTEDAYEVLIRGVLQLPDYLEHLLEGHPDSPILLLPLLNDLRAARGAPLLSENALFSPDLSVDAPVTEIEPGNISEMARKLRHHYQLGLLGWFRDQDSAASLQKIAQVIERLRKVASEQEINRLLWVAGGLVESLLEGGLDGSVSVKLLLGQLDRQIKKIIDRGEHALNMDPPSELLKNLLYYVATSQTQDGRTRELKTAFRLDEILPDIQTLEQARTDMAGPSTALMSTVSAVLMEDLLKVKDNLDLFVRADERNVADLEPLKDSLSQMADTLGMLGLGIQRESVQELISGMSAMLDGSLTVEDDSLMNMASILLELERSLNEVNAARVANEEAAAGKIETAEEHLQDVEQQKLLKTVIDEAKLELEQVKDAVNLFSKNPADRSVLDPVPAALDRIKGGISILNLERAASLLDGCIEHIRNNLLESSNIPAEHELDHLADAISSIEYYLESLAGQWGQPDAILDVAEHSLQQLQKEEPSVPDDDLITLSDLKQPKAEETETAAPSAADDDDSETLIDLSIVDTSDNSDDEDTVAEAFDISSHDNTDEDETLNLVVDESLAEDSTTDEINTDVEPTLTLEIDGFDSAAELNDESKQQPQAGVEGTAAIVSEEDETLILENQPDLAEPLVIDTGGVEGFDEEAPIELVTETETQADTEQDISDSDVEEAPDATLEASTAGVASDSQVETRSSPPVIEEIDEEIVEIFLEEGEEELERINEYLPRWHENHADEEALKELRRSFHTLKGSGRLVGAVDLGEFAWAYENMLNRLIDHTIDTSAAMFNILEQAQTVLPELFELFKESKKPDSHILVLIDHANNLSKGNPVPELEGAVVEESHTDAEPETEPEVKADALPEIDPVLLEIYSKEVRTHLKTLREYSQNWYDDVDRTACHSLVRALHTLKGSSRTTGVKPIAELCGEFEHYINELQQTDRFVPEEAVVLLNSTADYVDTIISQLNKPGVDVKSNEALLTQLKALFASISELPQTPSAMTADLGLDTEAELEAVAGDEDIAAELEVASLDEAIAEPEQVEEQQAPVSATEEIEGDEAEPFVEDYDEDLLEIFIEEGEEILESSESAMEDLRNNPQDQAAIEALQRYLHTLKGGARMAGVTPIGDLSHQIEFMLTDVAEGRRDMSDNIFTALQKSHDQLVLMIEQLKQRTPLSPVKNIMAQIDALLSGQDISIAADEAPEQQDNVVDTEEERVDESIELDSASENEASLHMDDAGDSEDNNPAIEAFAEAEEVSATDLLEGDESEPVHETNDVKLELVTAPGLAEEALAVEDKNDAAIELSGLAREEEVPAEGNIERRQQTRLQEDQVRVKADLLDNLVNFAGEVSIYRARMEQQTNSFRANLDELGSTVSRLREQLRQFEIETETQIQYRHEETVGKNYEDFDPLEFDRFTQMQHLSRAMMESLSDLDSLRGILANSNREAETLLLQQSRVNTELQEGLMRTRLVPFTGQSAKLRRIVRQTSDELDKKVELSLEGLDNELDRTVMDKIIPPLEHMLRNSIAHGIELPSEREKLGKPESGKIDVSFVREGSDIVIRVKDDGAGINLDAIREKAEAKGLIKPGAEVSEDILLNMIMESGFSTAEEVSQISGRGVGMDVVNAAIKQLGGVLDIHTDKGQGTTFTISLPLTLAITRALMVTVADEQFAIPLLGVQGVERIPAERMQELEHNDSPVYEWLGEEYQIMNLGQMVGLQSQPTSTDERMLPLLMVRSGEHRAAIQVDGLLGSREIVVKPVGPQLSSLRGVAGATIMGDGSVLLILDLHILVRQTLSKDLRVVSEDEVSTQPTVMVVDDSITVRKVTTRLLERNDYLVVSAKDGVDALNQLNESQPDIVLLDVEMPRMDGFELATNMRNDEKLKNIPIIMITSRTGDKHRERAFNIGVNMYMGKPFNEDELLQNIKTFVR